MPSISRVRRAGKCDCSTRRMISSFSEPGSLMRHREAMLRIDVSPIRDHAYGMARPSSEVALCGLGQL